MEAEETVVEEVEAIVDVEVTAGGKAVEMVAVVMEVVGREEGWRRWG